MITYIICIVVLIAAIPTTVWLRREGERRWAAHQKALNVFENNVSAINQALIQMTTDFAQFNVGVQSARLAIAKMNEQFKNEGLDK